MKSTVTSAPPGAGIGWHRDAPKFASPVIAVPEVPDTGVPEVSGYMWHGKSLDWVKHLIGFLTIPPGVQEKCRALHLGCD